MLITLILKNKLKLKKLIMNETDTPTTKEINDSILIDVEFLAKQARNENVDMKQLRVLMDKMCILLMGIAYE